MRITLLIAAMTLAITILGGTTTSQAQDCDALLSRGNELLAQSNSSRTQALEATNVLKKSFEEFSTVIAQYNKADAAGRATLEPTVVQHHATQQSNWTRYINALNTATQDIAQLCAYMKEFKTTGCGEPHLERCQKTLEYHKNQQAKDTPRYTYESSRGWRDYVSSQAAADQNQQATSPPEKKNPTVRIVNNAGIPICVHPAGLSGGSCFPSGKTRIYRMNNLRAWDGDSGAQPLTKQIVIVGGGTWTGSPYTSYHKMTLCTKRTFNHDDGEVEWIVGSGMEEECGVRGYHQ